ncbi:MAG: hypothetical protein H6747_05765 [Deltaproteobacteria bacterium]|nr:hypothetical protein [Deltaproteobacteria bacterium]
MKSFVWYEGLVFVGASNTAVDVWTMAPHDFLDFGEADQAYLTLEYSLAGPGAASVRVGMQRSAARVELEAAFESMEPTATTSWLLPSGTAAGAGVVSASYGLDQNMSGAAGTIRKLPRGIGRLIAQNAGAATEWAVVWLRCSVALVRG